MRLLRDPFLTSAVLLVLFAVTLAAIYSDLSCANLVCRGDFPAFYSGAHLAFSDKLYFSKVQQTLQMSYWPSLAGDYLYFAYPPYTAILYSPLALLSPGAAKAIVILISFLALLYSSRLAGAVLGKLVASLTSLSVILLLLPQNIIAVFAGQNTAISILLVSLVLFSKNPKAQGLASGIWWFKPQFAVFLSLGLLFTKNFRAFYWSLIPIGAFFLAAVLVQGPTWPVEWHGALTYFAGPEKLINAHRSISIPAVMTPFVGSSMMWIISIVVFCLFAFYSLFSTSKYKLELWIVASILLSPRTMFYDFGIILPVVFSFSRGSRKIILSAFALSYLAAIFGPPIESQILCILLIFLAVCLIAYRDQTKLRNPQ